jgi:PPOX class probable F420-dependent enzyme
MRLDSATARRLFGSAPVARLATVDSRPPFVRPHLVPIVFALADGDVLYTAVDAKPKATTALRRLANIKASPAACVLVDHYEDDWSRLWWVRADGTARVHDAGTAEGRHAHALLSARYAQYRPANLAGPVIAMQIERWTGWSAAELDASS